MPFSSSCLHDKNHSPYTKEIIINAEFSNTEMLKKTNNNSNKTI